MTGETNAGSPLSVLLVEDNEVNRRIALAFLASAGHSVTVCVDGESALEAMAKADYDVLLMDIQMPGIGGLETARRIRSLGDAKKARVPILAMSASVREEDSRSYFAAGMNGIIGKPLRREAVNNLLASVVADHSPPTADTETPVDVVDSDRMETLAEALGPARLAELCGVARQSMVDTADALRRAWEKEDRPLVASSAHRLAGVANNFGCPALGRVASDIETDCRNGGSGRHMESRFTTVLAASLAALPQVP
jgi:CheY-like chemotaxis protein/HPt (histidine-containing phosphotransfer) domain-containing protein